MWLRSAFGQDFPCAVSAVMGASAQLQESTGPLLWVGCSGVGAEWPQPSLSRQYLHVAAPQTCPVYICIHVVSDYKAHGK